MKHTVYRFVAGSQTITICSSSLIRAWQGVERKDSHQGIPREFKDLPITAFVGQFILAKRTWEGWHAELVLMRDLNLESLL